MAARRQVALVAPKTSRLSLSDRFALIQREAVHKKQQRPAAVGAPKAAKAVTLGANRAGRAAVQQTKVQAKKQAKQDAVRGKKGNAPTDTKKKAAAAGKKAAAAATSTQKGKGVKGDKQGAKQQDKKKQPKKEHKKDQKPATEADLDMEMAEYLHKAGRGPNPKQAVLDDELSAYKVKVAEAAKAEAAAPAPAADSAAAAAE